MAVTIDGFGFTILGVLIATILTGYMYMTSFVYNYWTRKGVAQIKPVAPLGVLYKTFIHKYSLDDVFIELYHRFGKCQLFGTYVLHKPILILRDPDLIRFVMIEKFDHFSYRGLYMNEKADPFTANLLTLGGTRWKNLRKNLSSNFTSGKLKQLFSIMEGNNQILLNYIEEKAKTREVIDISDLMSRFSTDTYTSSALGMHTDCVNNPTVEVFRGVSEAGECGGRIRNLIATFIPEIMSPFSFRHHNKFVTQSFTNMFKELSAKRKINNVKRNDFFDSLIQLKEKGYTPIKTKLDNAVLPAETGEEKLEKLTEAQIVVQAYLFFMAGVETTAATMSYCLYELSKYQDIQDKLREEIFAKLKESGELTYDILHQMPYLDKVISETLRMHPPVGILKRRCTKGIDLPGVNLRVEKGTDIAFCIPGIHSDPEYYQDPTHFDPERFSQENIAKRHPCAYIPFGAGPRFCIGMRFAMMEVKVTIISLISKYRFYFAEATSKTLNANAEKIVLSNLGGLHVRAELL